MGLLLTLIFAILGIGALILPWIHRVRIEQLGKEITRLNRQVAWLMQQAKVKHEHVEEADVPVDHIGLKTPSPWKMPVAETPIVPPPQPKPEIPALAKREWKQAVAARTSPKAPINFEQQFGANLPVWVGGIALALAGVFMVKYSIESGLLSPLARLLAGGIFGLGLLGAGYWVRTKSHVANDARIAQSLCGAGIVDLYACLFTATSIYHMMPAVAGFAGMGLVTVAAVFLSLRHGAPIALLGLIGGFLTPALVGSNEPDAPLLFMYLYALLAGVFILIRRKRWWFMAVPTVFCAYLWVVLWLSSSFVTADGFWLGLFVVAVAATVVRQSKTAMEEGIIAPFSNRYMPSALNMLTLGGSVLLMSVIAEKSSFGMVEWGLFGLLSAGGIALAYFNERLYGFVPKLSLAVNAFMLLAWNGADPQQLNIVLLSFAALYTVSGYRLMWTARNPDAWAVLTGAAALGYYLIAYVRLHDELVSMIAGVPVWGSLALLLSSLSVAIVKHIVHSYTGPEPVKQKMLAVFSLTATAFMSIGFSIEMKHEFLSVAFAAQVLAVSWINSNVNIRALRPIVGLLACAFGFLLIPQIVLLVQLTAYSVMEARLYLQDSIPIVDWPLFQLGVPAIMFIGSGMLLRGHKDDRLVRGLEYAAVALISVMGYYLTRHAFHQGENVLFVKAGFIERGAITNIIFLYGLLCFWIGRYFSRRALSTSAIGLCGVAMFRIAFFDLFNYNPVWAHQLVGATPVFNGLLLTYGLPLAWVYIAKRELAYLRISQYQRYTNSMSLALIFAYVTLNVRQFYQGAYLDSIIISNAEIYTYSAAWLLVGIGLLFVGTYRRDRNIRLAALAFMIVSVGKVFLYDASELTGLLRVFSFLGLGLSLLGLSWFYNRFISHKE